MNTIITLRFIEFYDFQLGECKVAFFLRQLIPLWQLPQIIIIDNFGNQRLPPLQRNKLQVTLLIPRINQPLMVHQDLQEFIIITTITITAKQSLF